MATNVIDKFEGPYHFLSNFYKAPFVWAGVRWRTSEHAYQAAKATGSDKDIWIDKIVACKEPGQAKRLGKKVPLRPKWDQIKDEMMRRVVKQKFVQNPTLLRKLIATENSILQEGNTWDDNYWGMCPPGNSDGKNMLGVILMEIREEFKDFADLPRLSHNETMQQMEDVKAEETKQ